jgi:hypothetical protein
MSWLSVNRIVAKNRLLSSVADTVPLCNVAAYDRPITALSLPYHCPITALSSPYHGHIISNSQQSFSGIVPVAAPR